MRPSLAPALDEIKARLTDVYKDRLKGIVLYGSEARGDATDESDLDLLVLLEGPVVFGRELDLIIRSLYSIQLELVRPISAIPVDVVMFEEAQYPLYRNAKREGIAL